MTALLESIGAPLALNAALSLALKQKVDAREKFAALNSKIEASDADIAGLPAEEQAAASSLQAEESKLQAAEAESMAAENEWVEEESAAVKAKDVLDALEFEAEDASKSLSKAETALSCFLELKGKIEAVRDHRALVADEAMQVDADAGSSPVKGGETVLEAEVA